MHLTFFNAMQSHISQFFAGALIAISALAAHAQTQAENTRAGTVKLVKGLVQLENTQGSKALLPGDAVNVADVLTTGADGATSLVLRDGSTLIVGPSSRLELKRFAFDATTQDGNLLVSVLRGTLRMITGLIGKTRPEAVEVHTPTTIIGVLGTDFIVQAEGEVKP
ncbi:FecR family protein [Variovorax sp. HJSM1_2]|uniref:FecR family protein n=1 Tax=Variovorax sp. HJSM1_2 TaxID=3366263 RepID=UPI003BCC947C